MRLAKNVRPPKRLLIGPYFDFYIIGYKIYTGRYKTRIWLNMGLTGVFLVCGLTVKRLIKIFNILISIFNKCAQAV